MADAHMDSASAKQRRATSDRWRQPLVRTPLTHNQAISSQPRGESAFLKLILDSVHDVVRRLMFPKPENPPPLGLKQQRCAVIALAVAFELVLPPDRVRLRDDAVLRAHVPEAPIEEYNNLRTSPNDISTEAAPRYEAAEIDPVPVAPRVQRTPDRQLDFRPCGPLPLHLPSDDVTRRIEFVAHSHHHLHRTPANHVLAVTYPRGVSSAEEVTSSQAYAVKQVRGPFVKLPPHPLAASTERDLASLARGFRKQGHPLAADLFAGAGGISLGLESVGYKVILGVDHFNFAVDTHHAHFAGMSLDWDLADPENVERVAQLIKSNKVELLAGGPPCQPFSKAGRSMIRYRVQSGLRDPHDQRRDLWRSFLEVVQIAKPPAVIMENVPDMALDREMFIFRSIVEELEQEGYSVQSRVIESWRYGVPQMRQRLIIVAIHQQYEFEWPKDSTQRVTLWNAIGELPPVEGGWRPDGGASGWADYPGPRTRYQRLMRARVHPLEKYKVFDHITRPVREDDRAAFESMTHKTKYTDLAPELQRYRKDIFDDKYKKLDENDLSRTITAHIAKDGYWYIHPRQARTLTIREAARIQSFPDDFRFAGPPSAAFKQIGNAVPPLVGKAIGGAVKEALRAKKPSSWSTREVSRSLSLWLHSDSPELSTVPWLRSKDRWKIAVAELLLERASQTVIRSVWPLISAQPTFGPDRLPDDEFCAILDDLLAGFGRRARVHKVTTLHTEMRRSPEALWEGTIDRSKLPSLPTAIADLAELAAPTAESEEPVLVTKGVLRAASRVFGNDVDKRNRQTDGRLAVARLVGIGAHSRHAHLGLIRLANDLCTVEDPACASCPLKVWCSVGNAANAGNGSES